MGQRISFRFAQLLWHPAATVTLHRAVVFEDAEGDEHDGEVMSSVEVNVVGWLDSRKVTFALVSSSQELVCEHDFNPGRNSVTRYADLLALLHHLDISYHVA